MKVRPQLPANFVKLDYPNNENECPTVPIGALSENEFEQFSKDTAELLRAHWEARRAALQDKGE